MTSAAQRATPRKPPRHVVLEPSAFADKWANRPEAQVAVGLRFISVEDIEIARNVAVRRAREWLAPKGKLLDSQAFDEAYNDQVRTVLVARAVCDPNDIGEPYFPVPEDTIRVAMTVEGVRRLWDELQILHAGSGVAMPAADDSEIHLLSAILDRGVALASASPGVALETRKLVSYLLEHLSPLDAGAAPAEPNPDGDEDDGILVIRGNLSPEAHTS